MMIHSPTAAVTQSKPWLDQHHAQLQRHVEQCWTRRAGRISAQCLDALHSILGGRFLTTVCAVAAVMLLPSLF